MGQKGTFQQEKSQPKEHPFKKSAIDH